MTRTTTRSLATAVTVAATATALAAALAGPVSAAGSPYVALGDSYSSGTGTRAYLADGTSCQRSVYAYPSLLAAARGYALDLRACAGATTADVTSGQLSALGTGTAYVTLSVGGNDVGFASVLTECAKPSWASNCGGAIDKAVATTNSVLPGRLAALYAAVRARAPRAAVVVVGYPRIFNGEDCNAFTWFSPTEESRLNAGADLIDSVTASAARAAGFAFADPTAAFVGHAVCSSTEWLNGLSNPVSDSYHPNRTGHASGYAPVVGARLGGSAVTVTGATLAAATASAPEQTRLQLRHAAQDRAVRPQPFVAPDLSSPAIRAAAVRAGVDLTSRASIDAADRAHDAEQVR